MVTQVLSRSDDGQVTTAAILAVEKVSFRYSLSQFGRPWTIEEASFDVAPGQVLGIVGPNGSGKSSLLKLSAGLLRPESGIIRLAGQAIGNLSPLAIARTLAFVPQEQAHEFPFTVAETVLMGRFPHRQAGWWSMGMEAEREEDLSTAHRAMVEADVVELADRLVSDLSGGERQRVMIARALAQEPRILLLDEPTAFLDLNHQIELCSLIQRLAKERSLTVVLVSHDLNVASLLCDRVLMVKDGKICAQGTPVETIRPEVLRAVYGCDVVVDSHPQRGVPRVTLGVVQ
ncbi:MAG: ABC transporter ATP-binding protein [Nitrospira sp.]|nr:ABC transporter ATP-binding protein [Nitrospira sp.]